jgi:hypothetical protein
VFALCPSAGAVIKVDTTARKVSGTLAVSDPRQAAVGEDLFVGSGAGMVQVDTDTLEVLHTYDDVGPGLEGAVAATADEVWVRSTNGHFLTGVDPRTHQVVATVDDTDFPSGGDVVITTDYIWATAYDDGVVVRVAR